MIKITNDNSFTLDILPDVSTNSKYVLVDVGAAWCNPCKRQHDILEKFSIDHPDLPIYTVDIDDCPITTSTYKIKSVPTLILFKNGQIHSTKVGLTSAETLEHMIND